jgi:hypothetical protein
MGNSLLFVAAKGRSRATLSVSRLVIVRIPSRLAGKEAAEGKACQEAALILERGDLGPRKCRA